MVFRKVLYVFLVNLLCCAHAISSDNYPDILSHIPKDVRYSSVYAFVTPADLASMSFVAKVFHQELSTEPFDLPTINQNGLKFAFSQTPLVFYKNAGYKQLTTLYRAYLRYINWGPEEDYFNLFPEFPLYDQNSCLRLCTLPLNPENSLNYFSRKKIVKLAIDKYVEYDFFSCTVMYTFIIPLLQGSKLLTMLSFDRCQMDESQWKSAFDAIARQSQVTVVKFENYKISEGLVNYLCNTNQMWRHKVKKLNFSVSENEYRISSTTFLNILTAFPNIENFESIKSCCLSEQFVLNAAFPKLNNLTTLKFAFDNVAVEILTGVSNNLSLMSKLEKLTIHSTLLEDVCVPILMQMKKQRTMLELDCFSYTKISLDAMREVVKVFTDLGYPQTINWAMGEPDFIKQYNEEYREKKALLCRSTMAPNLAGDRRQYWF